MILFVVSAVVLSSVYLFITLFLYTGLRKTLVSPPEAGPYSNTYSVIIAARNEEEHISVCLDSVFSQDIGVESYEVIVVNDRSSDKTGVILDEYKKRHPNLKVVDILEDGPSDTAPKTNAVNQGLKVAENEIVVFTDADCITKTTWLSTLDKYFTEETGLIQGMTKYYRPEGMNPLFYEIEFLEFLSHSVVSAASIGAGIPVNSNANNLAIRRELALTGTGKGRRVTSGDDDLLVQSIWRESKAEISFMADTDALVLTRPEAGILGFIDQRRRWGSKTVCYSIKQVSLLGSVFAFYLLILFSLIAGAFVNSILLYAPLLFVVKAAGELILMIPGTRYLKAQRLRKYLVPASVIHLPFIIAVVVTGVFGSFEWKGDRYKREGKSS